jgi:cytoskeletal protein RodZ
MQTLGERLEEARKRKGISIREAAEATKIRGDYLQKFEANSFDLDLPPLYVRGFVRAYARFLEFDSQRFLAEYDALLANEGRAPRRDTRENYGRVEFGGNEAASAPPSSSGSTAGLDPVVLKYAMLAGGVIVAGLLIWLVISLISSGSSSRPAAPKQTTSENAVAETRPIEAPAPAQTVTFTALDNTRVKIVQDVDKSVVYDGALTRGQSRSFPKTGVLLVTVEDRTKLRMEVNGRAMEIPQFPTGNYGRFRLD